VSADPTPMLRPLVSPAAPTTPQRTGPRESRVRVLQLGPSLEVRGGVSAVEQLICDYLPPYASIRHVATMKEGRWPGKWLTFAKAVNTLYQALDSIEPTVVHIHFASRGSTLRKVLLAQMVLRARRPLILHAHGGGFDRFHRGLPLQLRRMVNRTLQQANVLITLSSQWRDFYVRECELAPSQVVVLPNPVRLPVRIPDRSTRSKIQFLHLGKLGKGKGSYDLLEAFAALPDDLRRRSRLVLAGNGDVDELRRLAAPLNEAVGDGAVERVRVLSWISTDERDRLLAESDVFVLPSYVEGVPMSLLEAMAAGLPAITTPVGGIPDVFTHGREGLMVTPGDRTQLTNAMAELIRDKDARLAAGQRAQERARSHDIHTYAQSLAEIYQRIAPVAEARPGYLEKGA
jgi:glycosyltransferase involved in cell wall biosynthesis